MDDHATFPEPTTVRLERLLPGPIEKVWAFLTESDKRAQWFAGGEMEPRVGGKLELCFNHAKLSNEPIPAKYKDIATGQVSHRIVTKYDPPHTLGYTFGDPGPQGQPEVTFELKERGDKVLLILTHRRADPASVTDYASGWDAHTQLLIDLLNGVPRRPFWATHAKLKAEYEKRHKA
jgi:uncharacterized protein YndB with AHSA1/START domain